MDNLTVDRPQYSTTRQNAIEDAIKMQASVLSDCAALGKEPPPYQFTELIGKGSFGRVYKAQSPASGKLVAIKVINIEIGDAEAGANTFGDILKEIETLKLLGNTGAKNINTVVDAILIGHRVWMITEYCAGGSVSTLMRPRGCLPEQWVVPILREVAEAIFWTHKQGVIHRDIKCANVLINEDGGVQLCDFGVAAIVTTKFDKRSTFTGSLHWMAPELFNPAVQYGTEVDIWAFGSMAYEVASGLPPNANFRDINRFGTYLKQHQPQLQGDDYSAGLKDLISFCIVEDPAQRPVIEAVKLHPYIHNTSASYPTGSLSKLVEAYKVWEAQGGSRLSLFSAGGAQRETDASSRIDPEDEWTFSTTDELNHSLDDGSLKIVADAYDATIGPPLKKPRKRRGRIPPNKPVVAPLQKLFDPNTLTDYQSSSRRFYSESGYPPASDLPLRDDSATVRVRESLIDLDAAHGTDQSSQIKSCDVISTEATSAQPSADRRKTLEWKFPAAFSASIGPEWKESPPSAAGELDFTLELSADNRLSTSSLIDLDASIPNEHRRALGSSFAAQPESSREVVNRDSALSLIDLDAGLPTELTDARPSTAGSDCASSFSEQAPFELERFPLSSSPRRSPERATGSVCADERGESGFDPIAVKPVAVSSTAQDYSYLRNSLDIGCGLLPPAPPRSDVLDGSASADDSKEELARLVASLGDHLAIVGKVIEKHCS